MGSSLLSGVDYRADGKCCAQDVQGRKISARVLTGRGWKMGKPIHVTEQL